MNKKALDILKSKIGESDKQITSTASLNEWYWLENVLTTEFVSIFNNHIIGQDMLEEVRKRILPFIRADFHSKINSSIKLSKLK